MSLSAILAVTQMTQSQANKDVTVNDILSALESQAGTLSLSIAGGAGTTTLTPAQARYRVIELTGVITGNRVVKAPAGFDHSIVYINNTTGAGFTVSAQWDTGTTVVIPRGCAVPVRKNGGAAAYDFRAGMVLLPEVVAYRDSSTQSVTNATDTPVQFNAESRDNAEAYDAVTNFRFTAPAGGLYVVHTNVQFSASGVLSGNMDPKIGVRKNGTIAHWGFTGRLSVPSGTSGRLGMSAMFILAAGDYLDVIFREELGGGTVVIDNGAEKTWLHIHALRLS